MTVTRAGLSADKKRLLERLLRQKGVGRDRERDKVPSSTIRRRPDRERAPLSYQQQRLWFLDRLNPGSAAYNIPAALEIDGDLDLSLLARVLREMTRRHEVLRTTFPLEDGGAVQRIGPATPVPLPVVDVSNLDPERARGEAKALGLAEIHRPFDLGHDRPLRALVVRLPETASVVVLTVHHIVSDGWSAGLLVEDLAKLYEAFAAGRPSPLPELPIQYADWAAHQRRSLVGEALERQVGYWRDHLAGAPRFELPADRPRPATRTDRGASFYFHLPGHLSNPLGSLAREEGASYFAAALAAFDLTLARVGGQDDVSVGSLVANRTATETEGLIGLFVNTLVLRTEVDGDSTFRQLIGRVREVVTGAYAHQEVPFEALVAELDPERDLASTPLFQVLFVLQNAPAPWLDLSDVSIRDFHLDDRTAKFDLSLSLTQKPQRLDGRLEYRSDLFDRTTIARLARRFRRVLEAVLEAPDIPLAHLDTLGRPERQQVLAEWSDTAAVLPRGSESLPALFARSAERWPEAPAVTAAGETLTYRQLDDRSRSLAGVLAARGVGAEDRVGLFLERSTGLSVAVWGTLAAGAAYVPLDPESPPARLEAMAADAALAVVVTTEALAARLPDGWTVPVLTLEEASEAIGQPRVASISSGQLAYAIFTSGSTGRPKGAMNAHSGVVNRLLWMRDEYGVGPGDRILQKTPISFDVSVWELMLPHLTGAELVMAAPGGHRDAGYLAEAIREHGVTMLHFVPSMLALFLEETWGELPSLRVMIASGEALPAWQVEAVAERLPKVRFDNLYGPTEAAVDVTSYRTRVGDSPVPLGRPIDNLRLSILDPRFRPVAPGTAGELALGGVGVGRGYLGRPALTAERFVPDPSADLRGEPGARLYRTGDLARFRPDGVVDYLGRLDHQVKVRGVRIELGEVEAALEAHPAVARALAATTATGPESTDSRLVAYWVAEPGESGTDDDGGPSIEALRADLAERLPEAMVPSVFVRLDELPLLPSGKVDRKALPDPASAGVDRDALEAPYVAPSTLEEQAVAAVWSEVLGVERVGARDDFFALGGDSILSVRVLGLLRDRGLPLELVDLFRHRTVAALAAAVASPGQEADVTGAARLAPFELLDPRDRRRVLSRHPDAEDAYPLTRLQAGMLFHMALDEGEPLFHNVNSWQLAAPFDRALLETVWRRVVGRHEVLRSALYPTGFSEPIQVVLGDVAPRLPAVDLRGVEQARQRTIVRRFLEREERRSLDLEKPPLIRFTVLVLADDRFQLVLAENHAIQDGWSLHSTLAELFEIYLAAVGGAAPEAAPPLPVKFRELVALERAALESPESREYWAGTVADLSPLELPVWPAEPAASGMGLVDRDVPPAVMDGLQTAARRAGVPLKSLLLAAHLTALALWSGREDVVTGMVSNGRSERTGADEVRGLFLNLLPVAVDLSDPDIPWLDLARHLFSLEREILPHRRFPLADIERLRRTDDPGRLLEVEFNYIQFHVVESVVGSPTTEDAGPRLEVLSSDSRVEQTDLAVAVGYSVSPVTGELTVGLRHDRARVGEAATRRLAGLLEEQLRRAAEAPEASWRPAADAERHLLGVDWDDTRVDFPGPELTLTAWIERAVGRHPDAVAVSDAETSLSFRELWQRAAALAAELGSLGVGAEAPVGVMTERSVNLLVALVGVLRAGGAYVPLDPDHPARRLAAVAADAGLDAVVTTGDLTDGLPSEVMAPVVEVDGELPAPSGFEPPPVAPEQLAYTIFTSGSTGRPKGAMNAHSGVVNRLLWMGARYGVGPGDRILQKTPISFDVSVWELFLPLVTGAELVMARPGGHREPDYLAEVIHRREITVLHFVPSMLGLFLQADWGDLPSVRQVIASGEALPEWQVEALAERLPGAALDNLYGPTEAAVDVTFHRTRPGESPVPIGRPIANLDIHLVGPGGRTVPVGAAGELLIGGVGVGRGYLGRRALTAERFVPDPWSKDPGARVYRTGDLARWRPDGVIDYLGRLDHQVKVRGVRIELGELEAALEAHPAVSRAVVSAHNGVGSTRLVAHWLPEADDPAAAETSVEELRHHLEERLPVAMVPSLYVRLDELPLLSSGKVDRKALPDPEAGDRDRLATPYAAPETADEEALVAIWARVLGVERVGLDDDFFALGGDSILSLQTISAAREVGLAPTLQELFAARTVRRLAARLGDGEVVGIPLPEPFSLVTTDDRERLPADVVDAYPMTRMQLGMLFHLELEPEEPLFHNVYGWRLRSPWQPELFRRAVARVVSRHPIFRTSFHPAGWSEPLQLVHREAEVEVVAEDWSPLDPAERERAVRGELATESRRLFDPRRPGLVRFRFHRLDDGSVHLTVTESHLLEDGWSFTATLEEVFDLYGELLAGGEPGELVEGPPVMRRAVALERETVASDDARRFWSRWLDGARGPELGPPRRERHGRSLSLDLPPGLAPSLAAAARRAGVPVKSLLQAVHLEVLGLWGGTEDVLAGVVADVRPEGVEAGAGRGLFVNLLPLRLDLGEDRERGSWIDLARRVFAAERRMLPHRHFPLAELERLAGDAGDRRLVETELNFVRFHGVADLLAGEGGDRSDDDDGPGGDGGPKVVGTDGPGGRTDMALATEIVMSPDGRRMGLVLRYDAHRIPPVQARAVAATYRRLLAAAARDPGAPRHLDRLAPAERHALLTEASYGGATAPAAHRPVPQRFFDRAERLADAPAVVWEGGDVSYRDLAARVDRLASALRARLADAGPEPRVAVATDRSPALVTALLGVMASGAVYVPLDPDHPPERNALILDSAEPVLVVADQVSAPLVGAVGLPVLTLEPDGSLAEGTADGGETRAVRPSLDLRRLAYVLFTSGSTGRPKGVAISHGALASFLAAMETRPGLNADDRLLALTTPSFDIAALELYLPLLVGATVELASRRLASDGVALAEHLDSGTATVVQATPSTWRMVVEAGWRGDDDGGPRVWTGGEALDPELAAELARRSPAVWNLYGPTETTVWSAVSRVTAPGRVTLGTPIAGTRLYVVDRRLRPVPRGVAGELVIGGAGLARGYLGRPATTAGVFVPDPFGVGAGAGADDGEGGGGRLYRTGDLVRRDPGGALRFLGRLDHQVKVRGVRIELGEVEAVLVAHPSVAAAAAVVRPGPGGIARLVAFAVPAPEAGFDAEEIRRDLAARLPAAMVPSSIHPLAELPLTANRKVDRRALPEVGRETGSAARRPPETATERHLAELWEEILGVDAVGLDDEFFALGGHSLLAVRLIARTRDELGVELSLRDLFDAGSLGALAERVERRPGTEAPAEDRILAASGIEELSDADVEALLAELDAQGDAG